VEPGDATGVSSVIGDCERLALGVADAGDAAADGLVDGVVGGAAGLLVAAGAARSDAPYIMTVVV
jgi:hypothetical protein